jgi:hypothetical protein
MNLFLLGATAMAGAAAGLFFLRLWRESRDRLYVMFACAFWLDALARTALLAAANPTEAHPALYLMRVGAYGLILAAIADKTVGGRRRLK